MACPRSWHATVNEVLQAQSTLRHALQLCLCDGQQRVAALCLDLLLLRFRLHLLQGRRALTQLLAFLQYVTPSVLRIHLRHLRTRSTWQSVSASAGWFTGRFLPLLIWARCISRVLSGRAQAHWCHGKCLRRHSLAHCTLRSVASAMASNLVRHAPKYGAGQGGPGWP